MGTTTDQLEIPAATRQEPDDAQLPEAPIPSDTSPDEFYAEITKRADVRAILEELSGV